MPAGRPSEYNKMIIETKKIADLKPAPYNPRQSTAKQEEKLKASLSKFGLVEPIIFNKQTGYIVGGHFRVRELTKLGYEEIECVIVDLNEADEKELNIRLNANTGQWDWEMLANEWNSDELTEWGLDVPIEDEIIDEEYTRKIETPLYEPKNEKPELTELVTRTKTDSLIAEINKSDISKDDKDFLINAAQRHLVFDYGKIADYYSHAPKEIQELMEQSALVIIDFDKAIENGYVVLSDEIAEQYKKDHVDL
jgi:hypothetical protein